MNEFVHAIEIAEEDLLLNAHRADAVLNWFGERTGDRLASFRAKCAEVLVAALNTPLGQPVELEPAFHGDWVMALLAGWALARMGRAHPFEAPYVQVLDGVTKLGGGDLTVLQGPLKLSGTVKIDRMVLVAGSLEVDGLLDFCGDPGDCLLVIGDEKVRALDVGWAHFVIGSSTRDVTRWSYDAVNDGLSYVTGESHSLLTITNNHGSLAEEEFAARPDNPLRACLEPRVDGPLDSLRVCELIGAGTHRLVESLRSEHRTIEIPDV